MATSALIDTGLSFHTLQNKNSEKIDQKFTRNNRTLLHDLSSETVYETSKNKEKEKTTVHYGRRQLLINEIEFLTICLCDLEKEFGLEALKTKKLIVFYAGAAIGKHFLVLAEFFPIIHKFILVDKEEFKLEYGNKLFKKNIQCINRFFDINLAEKYLKEYNDEENYIRLFISDIRRTDKNETLIEEDMDLQANIHRTLKPFKSYLKFRLPYFDKRKNNIEKTYLGGDIYFLIWGRSHTSETRLLVHKDSLDSVTYDNRKYENQLFHFNKNERTFCYEHDIIADGFDHCYDCRAEIFVLEEYLKIYDLLKSLFNTIDNKKKIAEYANYINEVIEASDRDIEFSILIDGRFLSNKFYKFTAIKFDSIKNQNDLRKFVNKASSSYKSSQKTNYDITKGMGRLNIS